MSVPTRTQTQTEQFPWEPLQLELALMPKQSLTLVRPSSFRTLDAYRWTIIARLLGHMDHLEGPLQSRGCTNRGSNRERIDVRLRQSVDELVDVFKRIVEMRRDAQSVTARCGDDVSLL
jgi:hypothetical protein